MVGIEYLNVIKFQFGHQDGVQGFYVFTYHGAIEEEGVHVELCDLGSEGYPV